MPGLNLNPQELSGRGFTGLKVIPDVHGDFDAFSRFTQEAADEKRFVVQLGDLTDRGPKNPEVMQLMCEILEAQSGQWTLGNHCWKALRTLRGEKTSYKPEGNSLGKTMRQLAARKDRDRLVPRWVSHAEKAPHWIRVGKYLFAHGAVHVEMLWSFESNKALEQLAMYGMTKSRDEDGNKSRYPVRIYDWTDDVPYEYHAIVGHQVVSRDGRPVHLTNPQGGEITFLDCGAGFDSGSLVYLDLPLS